MNEKPKHFIVLKIIGIICLLLAIYGVVLSITGFGDFESNKFMIGGFLSVFGLGIGVPCTVMGFRPEITKMSMKSAKYIQQENKQDLKDISTTQAHIMEDSVTITAQAVKEGLNSTKEVMYCKHCGGVIDADSTFCKHCGKSQN